MRKFYGDAYLLDDNGRWLYAHDQSLVPSARTIIDRAGAIHMEAPDLLVDQMLDITLMAELLGVVPRSVSVMLSRGDLPKPQVRLGGSPLWTRPVIEAWKARRARAHVA